MKEDFKNLDKLYILQVIDNSRDREVLNNWYSNFVGELFIVRVRPNESKTTWTLENSPNEITYEVARIGTIQKDYTEGKRNFLGNGFDNKDIKIIAEYSIPEPEQPFVLKDGTKVFREDVDGIIEHFKL